ncbi:hypothetical protein C0Q70_06524 [Pomacea canaliculata]|uniref:Uncharacterized protein n=1 Tax=Pomacea canaliculata TaxID=400727 RepID=A0A2T7PP85_POMCA|nr:hypothetical protein C0Q70_06524 [Pomacea canaliculata]
MFRADTGLKRLKSLEHGACRVTGSLRSIKVTKVTRKEEPARKIARGTQAIIGAKPGSEVDVH